MSSIVLVFFSRLLIAFMFIFSLWLLWRGHNLPGGGFIGGLVAACAFALYLFAHEHSKQEAKFRAILIIFAYSGLFIATLSGLVALFSERPYFSTYWYSLPLINIKIGTPFFFDLGVYLLVAASQAWMILNFKGKAR